MATVAPGSALKSLAVTGEPTSAPAALQVPTSPAARSTGSPVAWAGIPTWMPTSVTPTSSTATTTRPTRPLRTADVRGMPGNSTPSRVIPALGRALDPHLNDVGGLGAAEAPARRSGGPV